MKNDEIQNMRSIINGLKVRLFDANETIDMIQSQIKERESILTEIVRLLEMVPDEAGTIQLDMIPAALSAVMEEVKKNRDAVAEEGGEVE